MTELKRLRKIKLLLSAYYMVGFIALLVYIPKDASKLGLHSLVITTFVFILFFYKNWKWLSCYYQPFLQAIKTVVVSISVFLLTVLFTSGYLQILDSILLRTEYVCVQGNIVNKFADKSKLQNVNYYIDYEDDFSGLNERVRVTLAEFDSMSIGDKYEKVWKKGAFGYVHLSIIGSSKGSVKYKGKCSQD